MTDSLLNAWLRDLESVEIDRWKMAEKLTPEQALARFEQLYVEDADTFGLTADVISDHADGEYPRMRIYGTTKRSIKLDADWILENATEDLHEEAYANIPASRVTDLQVTLDAWCETVAKATETYFPDYRYAVVLPEAAEEDGEDEQVHRD